MNIKDSTRRSKEGIKSYQEKKKKTKKKCIFHFISPTQETD